MVRESRFKQNILTCSDWSDITKKFAQLPKPRRDPEEEGFKEGWVFRGHTSRSYRLQPSIEREPEPDGEWPKAEYTVLQEFQSKARMYMDAAQLPDSDIKLGWLAIMPHYGAPTRLLDFTYSPYIALYFALRNREEASHAEIWGIDAAALRSQAEKTSRAADKKVRDRVAQRIGGVGAKAKAEKPKAAEKGSDWRANCNGPRSLPPTEPD